ncbi:MAG: glycosyltransferase [Clostridia bacterium]|nr:glycosyltransferase [Clostridia bacterium]
MPKISVIIPVYNTEKYLKKCLDSVINQTYQDFEIIIVNDGSTDNSDKIIKEYTCKNPEKIKSYKKENGGLSSARNYGLSKATGEYISFIDSDDYIDHNLFNKLKGEMEKNTDLIKFKLTTVDIDYKEISKIDGPVFKQRYGEEAFNSLVFKDELMEPACIYLYKKSLLIENNFKFSENKYHEDFGLTPIILLCAKTVASINFFGYFYVQSNNTITRNDNYQRTIKRANDLLFHYDRMKDEVEKIDIELKTKENIYLYYSNAIFNNIKNLKKSERKKYIEKIKQRKLINNIKVTNIKRLIKKIILLSYMKGA